MARPSLAFVRGSEPRLPSGPSAPRVSGQPCGQLRAAGSELRPPGPDALRRENCFSLPCSLLSRLLCCGVSRPNPRYGLSDLQAGAGSLFSNHPPLRPPSPPCGWSCGWPARWPLLYGAWGLGVFEPQCEFSLKRQTERGPAYWGGRGVRCLYTRWPLGRVTPVQDSDPRVC